MSAINKVNDQASFNASSAMQNTQNNGSSVSAVSAKKVIQDEDMDVVQAAKTKDEGPLTENGRDGSENPQKVQEAQGNSKSANEEIKKAVDALNKKMLLQNSEAIFGIHDKTNRLTIKIVDKNTKEIIKEYPPEKSLDVLARMWEMAGILVDEKR